MENSRQTNDMTFMLLQSFLSVAEEMPQKLTEIKTQLNTLPTTQQLSDVTLKIDTMKGKLEDLWALYHSTESQKFMLNIAGEEDITKVAATMVAMNIKLENIKKAQDDIMRESGDKKFYASMWFKTGLQLIATAGVIVVSLIATSSKIEKSSNAKIEASIQKNMEATMVKCIKRIDEEIEAEIVKIHKLNEE